MVRDGVRLGCGSCVGGAVVSHDDAVTIQRCDDCEVFANDDEATDAVWAAWVDRVATEIGNDILGLDKGGA